MARSKAPTPPAVGTPAAEEVWLVDLVALTPVRANGTDYAPGQAMRLPEADAAALVAMGAAAETGTATAAHPADAAVSAQG